MQAGLEYRWDDVKVFLAVMRERTLAGASARLEVDASTVSRRLGALEEALGAQLFDRTRDGLLPTAAAEKLFAAAEETEASALRLSRAAEELEALPEGLVRLTSTPGLAEAFVIPYLIEFHAQYPLIRLEVEASSTVADLSRREADLAIRTFRPTGGDLVMTRLMNYRYGVLATPAYAAEIGLLVDPSTVRWIGWSRELAHVPSARWLSRYAPGVEPILRVSSIGSQLIAVGTGLGVAVLPGVYASLEGLSYVTLGGALDAADEALPEQDVFLVGHRALRDVPRIAAVWQFFVSLSRRTPATPRYSELMALKNKAEK